MRNPTSPSQREPLRSRGGGGRHQPCPLGIVELMQDKGIGEWMQIFRAMAGQLLLVLGRVGLLLDMGLGVFGLLFGVYVIGLLPNGDVGWLLLLCSVMAGQRLLVFGAVGLLLNVVGVN